MFFAGLKVQGSPNRAGLEHGQENTCFRIGLVLAYSKSSTPGYGILRISFIISGTSFF